MKPGRAAAVFAAALLLRLQDLGAVFPVNDEFMQFYEALAPGNWARFLRLLAQNPHHVLLDPASTRLMSLLSGGQWALRLPSAVWGAAAAWLLCRLGTRHGRPGLGLAAAAALAANPLCLDWSRRADFYALLAAASIWCADDFLSLLERRGSWRKLALSAAVFLLGHPYAVLMAAFQGVFVASALNGSERRRAAVELAKAWGAAGLAFLPWFLFSTRALLDLSTFDFTRNTTTLGLGAFLAGLPAALALRPEAGPLSTWIAWLGAAALLAGWLRSAWALRAAPRPRLLLFSHALVAFGAPAVILADLAYRYYMTPRQLLWLLPFLLLAAADGWRRLLDGLGLPAAARAAAVAAAVVAGIAVDSGVRDWQVERARAMDGLVLALGRAIRPGERLYFENDQLAAAALYFMDKAAFESIADMRLVRGMMSYALPEGLTVSLPAGGGPSSLHAAAAGQACAPKPDGWMFCGALYEMTVLPPAGRTL